MKKILVPCDFSKTAVNAYRQSLDIARQSKAAIELIHVIELPILNDSVLMPVLNFEKELLKELKAKSEERFEKLIAKFPAKNIKVRTNVVFGAPSTMIADAIVKNNIDLIVMGSHGASGLRELFIGSNAEKIVRKATAPVLVVKEYKKLAIKNIIFPNDVLDENQAQLVEKVKSLQKHFKAKLHLVRINTLVNFKPDLETLADMNAFASHHGLRNFTINIFNAISEATGIIEFATFIGADLIAMGTHGRRGLAQIFNQSKAEDVVNHTSLPIWTYATKSTEA